MSRFVRIVGKPAARVQVTMQGVTRVLGVSKVYAVCLLLCKA